MTEPPLYSETEGPIHGLRPRVRRSGPNLRMLRLLIVVIGLGAIVFGVRQLACTGDPEAAKTGSDAGSLSIEADSEVTVGVGERFSVAGIDLVVTSLMPVVEPTRPRYPVSTGAAPGLQTGEAYYQAFVRAENPGQDIVRLGPEDFSLEMEDMSLGAVPALSGPAMRSMLAGSTFDLILTYIVPEGSVPTLVYRSDSGAVVRVEGVRAPEAFEPVTTSFRGDGLVPWRTPVSTVACA